MEDMFNWNFISEYIKEHHMRNEMQLILLTKIIEDKKQFNALPHNWVRRCLYAYVSRRMED